jgi:P27 family predicted phage terminase small subunit
VPANQGNNKARRRESQEGSVVGKLAPLTVADVPPPDGMPAGRIRHYGKAVTWIVAADVATIGDRMGVTELARVWADIQQVNFLLEQDGLTQDVEDRLGNVKKMAHPLLGERARLRTMFKNMLSEFGMTPNARRMMLQADPKKEVDQEDAEWSVLMGSNERSG